MSHKPPKSKFAFQIAVQSTPDIATGFRSGLSALRGNSTRIEVAELAALNGSVDIDSCTASRFPNSNRWDYAFAYHSDVYFVEVHSAYTSEVKVVISKLKWLKDWLHSEAPLLNELKAKICPFVWIHTKRFDIPKGTPQYRLAKVNGLLPMKKLVLPH